MFNTDAQIFADAGLPVVLLMEHYDIDRSGYHDTLDTLANIDLDFGAALMAIAIETIAEEMAHVLFRMSFSSIIRESEDLGAGLGVVVVIRHLVKKDRTAARTRQQSRRAVDPGQVRGLRDHEGRRPAVREIVKNARDQAFAGTVFAGDQHRKIGIQHPRDQPIQRLHRRRAADQRQLVARLAQRGRHLRRPALLLQRTGRPLHQVRQVEGLRQIVEGFGLGGLDGGHDGILRRDHDHRQAGAQPGDPRQRVQPVAVGHDDVGNHQIALALLDPAHQRHEGRGRVDLAARAGQRLGQHRADRAVVVGDKKESR